MSQLAACLDISPNGSCHWGIRLPLDRGIANIPYKSNSKPDARFLLFSES